MGNGKDTWADWLNNHGRALVAYARQWTQDHADAEDIVQEAFVRFWRCRGSVQDPLAYLYVCAKRCACDFLRAKRRGASLEEENKPSQKSHGHIFNHCPMEMREIEAAVERALGRLPVEQREVLILKIWGGLTFEQISQVMDVSSNTAASRYRYALDALKRYLNTERVS